VDDVVENGRRVKALHLDALLHSYVDPQDPTFLVYNYEKIFAEITTYMAQRNPNLRLLFIGGGGYTMPRYIEAIYPQSTLEVVEIDPEVTRVAFDYLGLSPDTDIVTYNEDARMAVPRLPEDQYDLVIGDAFNDLSVPYHLTTEEFNEQVRVRLKDSGLYAVNVVDKLRSGRFLMAYVNTLQQTFPYVYVIRDSPDWEDDSIKPNVVVGSFQPLSSEAISEANAQAGRSRLIGHIIPEDILASLLNAHQSILLTDDYAPVDNLLAHLHLEKHAPSEAEEHYNAGIKLMGEGKLDEAIVEFTEAVGLAPSWAEAYFHRGNAYGSNGEYDLAIADYTEAIGIDQEYVEAYSNRGLAYGHKGEYDRAIADYAKAIEINPENAETYNNRGVVYRQNGEYDRAIADYTRAVETNPEYAGAYFNRGVAFVHKGEHDRAIADYTKAIEIDPEYVEAYFNRGLAYKTQGKKADAMADFVEFITLTDNPQWIQAAEQQIEELKK
jgi:tetratricopeptide (TPR) repeat protein